MSNHRIFVSMLGAVVLVATTASFAGAGPVYLAQDQYALFRVTDDGSLTVESFDLGQVVRGMHYDHETGEVVGIVAEFVGGGDFVVVNNAVSGVPSLTVISELTNRYPCVTKADGLYWGVSGEALWTIDISDPANPIETIVGPLDATSMGSIAYDIATDTMYTISKITDDLYTIDRITGEATLVGPLGIDSLEGGAEWFDGQLHALVQNGDSGYMEIGAVDTATGAYSTLFSLPELAADNGGGLAIIPEPAGLALGVTALGALLRRRRQ